MDGVVIVKNTGEKPFSRAWNSIEYDFPPGEEVTIPERAAMYLFGFGMGPEVRARCLARNGWLSSTEPVTPRRREDAMEILDGFVFKRVEMGGKKRDTGPTDRQAPGREKVGRETLHLAAKAESSHTRRQPPA